jgi:hypothetical protein
MIVRKNEAYEMLCPAMSFRTPLLIEQRCVGPQCMWWRWVGADRMGPPNTVGTCGAVYREPVWESEK